MSRRFCKTISILLTIVIVLIMVVLSSFLISCGNHIKETETVREFESYIESYNFVDKVEITDNHKMFSSERVTGLISIFVADDIGQGEVKDYLISNVLRELYSNNELKKELLRDIDRFEVRVFDHNDTIIVFKTFDYYLDEETIEKYDIESDDPFSFWLISESDYNSENAYPELIILSDNGYVLRDSTSWALIDSKEW